MTIFEKPLTCMAKPIHLFIVAALSAIAVACGSEKSISDRIAMGEVTHYLASNPVYETADMAYGEVKFNQKSDADLLSTYRELEKGGYVSMERMKERKRFLSKD